MAPHLENPRYWISGQANTIAQMHGHFKSPYEGPNSLIDAHVWRGLFGMIGGTFIVNPGYNRDRRPAYVDTTRVHIAF